MALWFAAILGLIQGLTEFIPVSSSAHLKIAPAVFGQQVSTETYTAYIAVIQLGTLIAVLIYFARDLIALVTAMIQNPSSHEGKLLWMIAAGTVPIVVLGLVFKHRIEAIDSLRFIATMLIVFGIVLALVDRFGTRGGDEARPLTAIGWRDVMLIGLAQTLALVPGVSRSGSTICMALLLGFARSDAARFSFLLSIPAVGGAGILEAWKAIPGLGSDALPALGIGIGVAGVTGYITIAWLLRWLGTHQLMGFAIYRIACGGALLAALTRGWL